MQKQEQFSVLLSKIYFLFLASDMEIIPDVSQKTPSGYLTLTNIKTQSWTVVIGLATSSPVL